MRVSLDAAGRVIGIVGAWRRVKVRIHGAAEIGRVIEGAFRSSRGTRTPWRNHAISAVVDVSARNFTNDAARSEPASQPDRQ